MSTSVFPRQDNAWALYQEYLIPGEAGIVGVGERAPARDGGAVSENIGPISTDCRVYKVAEFISRVFIRLFGVTVNDAGPLEDSDTDSDNPGCWACCS